MAVRWDAVVVATCVWSAQAWATVGGPSYVTDVRYDAAARTVYYVRTECAATGDPPMVAAFRLGDPRERIARKVTNPVDGNWELEEARWARWERRLEALPHLVAPMGQPVRLRLLGTHRDSTDEWAWGRVDRRIALVEVRSGDLVGRVRITSYGRHDIQVCNLYDVPGCRRRVAILRALERPYEMGYTVDTIVLLAPERSAPESPVSPPIVTAARSLPPRASSGSPP